ncbi:uncharacterized protein LOC111271870 [Varroa jacobsoni]|uniref:uncharacterized protein LOC111271870 n=1 Tax=Varroa jacobsoni TaxID=62625 RepID=UPI000BF3F299|nr:uncharacterized protein LOC111271870 [Varroa jacobsoni]
MSAYVAKIKNTFKSRSGSDTGRRQNLPGICVERKDGCCIVQEAMYLLETMVSCLLIPAYDDGVERPSWWKTVHDLKGTNTTSCPDTATELHFSPERHHSLSCLRFGLNDD